MKTKLIFFSLLVGNLALSQVAIGKESITNSSVSLEFGDGNKGLVVPYVTSQTDVTGAVNGTIIFDQTDKKMKYMQNGTWSDLSPSAQNDLSAKFAIQNNEPESTSAKVSIGNQTTTPGILVLEDSNKAMILPKVASPHLNILNPEPGLMVYDTVTKQLCIFNGEKWAFWKP